MDDKKKKIKKKNVDEGTGSERENCYETFKRLLSETFRAHNLII